MDNIQEFRATGNGWTALAFLVGFVIGVLFIIIQPFHSLGWLLAIAGAYGGWQFVPRNAEANRKRAETIERRRIEYLKAAAESKSAATPYTGRLTLWQQVQKFVIQGRKDRAADRMRHGEFGAVFDGVIAAGQEREIEALRYWNSLPSRVQVRFIVDPEKAKLGPASLKRRSQNDLIHVGLDSTATGEVPIIRVATAMMGALGRLPDDWAIKLAPFFEVGGRVKAKFVDVGIDGGPNSYATWAVLELSPTAN